MNEQEMREATRMTDLSTEAMALARRALRERAERIERLETALLMYQHAVQSGGNVNDLEACYRHAQEALEPGCNPHPDAPHGFNRNASHNAGRYVCDCEGWEQTEETK